MSTQSLTTCSVRAWQKLYTPDPPPWFEKTASGSAQNSCVLVAKTGSTTWTGDHTGRPQPNSENSFKVCQTMIWHVMTYHIIKQSESSTCLKVGVGVSCVVPSVLIISTRKLSNWGSQVPEPLLMLTATCALKAQISQGLGPFSRLNFWKLTAKVLNVL